MATPVPSQDPADEGGPGTPLAGHVIRDPANGGRPVGSFAHPPAWQASSFIAYNPNDYDGIGLFFARALSRDGCNGVEIYPNENFHYPNWSSMPTPPGVPGRYQIRVGDLCFGSSPSPAMSAADTLARHIIPRHRGAMSNGRVIGSWAAPWLMQALPAPDLGGLAHDTALVRIGYDLGQVAIEEEFTCCAYWFPADGNGNGRWGTTLVRSTWAPAGRLDSVRERRLQILRSFALDPSWTQWCVSIGAQLAQNQQMMASAMVQNMFANEDRERQMRSDYLGWSRNLQQEVMNQRSESDAWRQRSMGDILSGQTRYHDPSSTTGQPFQDTHYYAYMWTDGQGQFRGSNDANFDPNVGADRTWTQTRRVDER